MQASQSLNVTLENQFILSPARAAHLLQSRPQIIPVFLLFLALVFQLVVRLSVINQAYQYEEINKQVLAKDTQLRRLELESAGIIGPKKLRAIAKENFGLDCSGPQQIRKISLR